jgi:chorismate-pyruvate lyase
MRPEKITSWDEINHCLQSDLYESSHRVVDLSKLNVFQRIILTSDGTLTEILETYLLEKLQVVKLDESVTLTTESITPLEVSAGQRVISRKILLQGKISQKNWLYAESLIILDRLEEKFRDELLKSRIPIGRLWSEHRIETFKEMMLIVRENAGKIASYFEIEQQDQLFSRTYRVFCHRRPVMMITEKFPEDYFTYPLSVPPILRSGMNF